MFNIMLQLSTILIILVVIIVIYNSFKSTNEPYNTPNSSPDKRMRQQIVQFFRANPYPSDKKVHGFAKKLGVNKHKFEEMIYAMLTDLLK